LSTIIHSEPKSRLVDDVEIEAGDSDIERGDIDI